MLRQQLFSTARKRLDTLFLLHAVISILEGGVAFLLPHFWQHILIYYEGDSVAHAGGKARIAHIITRLYGALILVQGWFVWNIRKVENAAFRKAVVQGYSVLFFLSGATLLRAQLTDDDGTMSGMNWLNITLFFGLCAYYAYFVVVEPIKVFQGIGKSFS